LSETSISSSYLMSFFLFLGDLLESVYLNTKDLKCQHGHTWIPRICVGKYQEFQGWYTRTI
jgi:hypothetical protein